LNFYQTILKPVQHLLLPADKKKGIFIIALMVLNALLDFFSLASFLPLIFLIVDPNFIFTNKYSSTLYSSLGFTSPTQFILFFSLCLLVFVIVKNSISFWITRVKANYCFQLGSDLSSRMLAQFMEISFLKFIRSDYTKELNRIANIPIAFANNIIMPLANLLTEGLVFALLMICIASYDIKIFLLLALIIAPIRLIYYLNRKGISTTSEDLKKKYPLSLKFGMQAIEGWVDIKASVKENFFKKRFVEASRSLANTFVRDHVNQTGPSRLTEIITAIIICAVIGYSLINNQNTQQTFLLIAVYAGASFRMIPSINRILNALMQIKSHEYLLKELEVLISFPPLTSLKRVTPLVLTRTIELKNIFFQYPDGAAVLSDSSLTIQRGEKIALVGKSGSGKTTILLILLQFLKPNSGKIFLDGVEVRDNTSDLRKIFSYVSQSPYIMDGTIAENIAFGFSNEEIHFDKIYRIIKDLDLEPMIKSFPDGLATQIGEKGIKLSGGQRQRIAIARALYANSEVLLFDEITNQLDVSTEKEIINILIKVAHQNKTILMITHHEHLLNEFDKVLALEDGKIVERTLSRISYN
jgi:ABC-type multidrug transport system fused ATPase/permease subunit